MVGLHLAILCTGLARTQGAEPKALRGTPDLPAFFAAFEREVGGEPRPPGRFHGLAIEWLWKTYEWPAATLAPLLEHVRKAPDGPGRTFAGLAAAAYHDPGTAEVLVEIARAPETTPLTRYWFLNAAPCVLSIGDVWFDGSILPDARAVATHANGLLQSAAQARELGIGRRHAQEVRQTYDVLVKTEEKDLRDIPLALWHASAYLEGHIDLRDRDLLLDLLRPDRLGPWSMNLASALAFATNRDFAGEARQRSVGPKENEEEAADEFARAFAAVAREWWEAFDPAKASGDWRVLVIENFAGYRLDPNALSAPDSLRELRRALRDECPVRRYNAYRLLNHLADAHFDLDFVLFLGKYAGHPLAGDMKQGPNEDRLRKWGEAWIDARLLK